MQRRNTLRSAQPHQTVRRRSLFRRLFSLPGDWYLWAMESYETLNWHLIGRTAGTVLGITLNLAYLLAKTVKPDNQKANRSPAPVAFATPFGTLRCVGGDCSAVLRLFMLLLSVANAAYFFARSRKYRFFHTDPLNPPNSQNIKLVPRQQPSIARRMKSALSRPWFRRSISSPSEDTTVLATSQSAAELIDDVDSLARKQDKKHFSEPVYELKIWDISVFHRNLFCLFSPLQVLLLHGFTGDVFMLAALFMVPATLLKVVTAGYALAKDKEVIFSHVMQEYNAAMVYPRVCSARRSVRVDATGTGPDDRHTCDTEDSDTYNHGHKSTGRRPLAETGKQNRVSFSPPVCAGRQRHGESGGGGGTQGACTRRWSGNEINSRASDGEDDDDDKGADGADVAKSHYGRAGGRTGSRNESHYDEDSEPSCGHISSGVRWANSFRSAQSLKKTPPPPTQSCSGGTRSARTSDGVYKTGVCSSSSWAKPASNRQNHVARAESASPAAGSRDAVFQQYGCRNRF